MNKVLKSTKRYLCILFMFIALIMPELMLHNFIGPGVFDERYVFTATSFFAVGWAAFFILLCIFVLPSRVGKAVFLIVTICFSAFSLSECVYYKIFEQFFRVKSICLAGEGADYFDYAVKLIEPRMLVCLGFGFISVITTFFVWSSQKINKKSRIALLLVPVAVLVATHICMLPGVHGDRSDEWDVWRKPRAVYNSFNDVNKCMEICGLYQFVYRDLYNTVFDAGKIEINDKSLADEYFTLKGKPEKNRFSGFFEGKNVIVVMMESMDTWMIDEETTPTICKMMNEGIRFVNYNAPFFGVGFTLSSEFAFNTGFFTPVSAGSASNFSRNTFPYSIARLFSEAGYSTKSFHFNSSEFYNRGIMHKNYGYEKYYEAADFGITGVEEEMDSNLIKNDEFYQKMIESKPFFNFFISYSAHLPYLGESKKLTLAKEYRPELVDETEIEEKNNAMILAADTDEFFRILTERLEADGLLDDTVIVAYTDHFAYGISSEEQVMEWKGDTIKYCVPAFIYNPSVKPMRVHKPMMTIDWAPTIANLFALSDEAIYIGSDAMDSGSEGFVYFETGAWLDETMHYLPGEEYSDADDLIHIQKQTLRMKNNVRVNDIVILGDYYKY